MEDKIGFINEVRSMLWKTVDGMSEEQLNEKFQPDSWSVMQVLEHLYLIEKSITKSIEEHLKSKEDISVPVKPIQLTVDRSTKVEAPSYVRPSSEFIPLQLMNNKLNGSREDLLDLIRRTNKEELQKRGFRHPIFGMLSLDQWVEFIGYHEKRHTSQIEEILTAKGTFF
jgi:hypothetical protein